MVNLVSRFMQCPHKAHLQKVKSIMPYMKGTIHCGLFYKTNNELVLTEYIDADWGGDIDEHKSTRVFLFTICGTPITWCTKKQTCVTLSSTESEYRALIEATKEAI